MIMAVLKTCSGNSKIKKWISNSDGYPAVAAVFGTIQYMHSILSSPQLSLSLSFTEHLTQLTMLSQPRQKKTMEGATPGTTQEVWSRRREPVS